MATMDDARNAIIDSIYAAAEENERAEDLLQLAEAWAWLRFPNQPHGGRPGSTD